LTLSLEIEGLCVDRGGRNVVTGLSYANDRPAWIGLVGANGSGKTTLLRALAGRLPIRSGRILFDGVDLGSDRAGRARRVGFAIDAAMLPDDLTPRELFAISAERKQAIDAPALQGLRSALNIEDFIDWACGSLSAGMRQRVALVGAFLDLPGIVILDEPFNWLDPLTAYDTKRALRSLVAAQGITLITALHDVSTLTAYCDRGILMSGGRIALALEEAELRDGVADPVAFEAKVVDRLRAEG
jgi:ABC-type multidrug transport system ATPase subunit